jgi:hypothetical protein
MATMTTPNASQSGVRQHRVADPANSNAIRIDGNESITSQIRMMNASRRPPTYSDTRPAS